MKAWIAGRAFPRPLHSLLRRVLIELLVGMVFLLKPPAWAGGTVPDGSEASLRATLAGGGTVTFAVDGTFTLSQTLDIGSDTVLDGAGHTITLDGNHAVRVLYVEPNAHVTLQNLTVANGLADQGGGLYNAGAVVTVSNCIFTANQARGTNGADAAAPWFIAQLGGPGNGGAIFNAGSLVLLDSTFSTNAATGGQGGSDALFSYARNGGAGVGGALYSVARVDLTDCVFSANQAVGGTGGSEGSNAEFAGGGGDAFGGALANQGGAITQSNCSFIANTVSAGQMGPGVQGQYRGTAQGGAIFNATGTVTIATARMVSNSISGAPTAGGAIYHGGGLLTLSSSTLLGNTAVADRSIGWSDFSTPGAPSSGGGLFDGATATITDCSFASNSVSGGPGNTTYESSNGGIAQGAGLCNTGTLDLLRSLLVGNTARGGLGYPDANHFLTATGGVAYGGAVFSSGRLVRVINCTLVGNQAVGGGIKTQFTIGYGAGADSYGGAFYNTNGLAGLTNCTVFANGAFGGPGD